MAVNRVPGVIEAEFSYEEGSGVVTYDPDVTSPDVFIEELVDKTGFLAAVLGQDSQVEDR